MKATRKFSERVLSFLLSFIMIFTLIPAEVYAADDVETISINFNQQPIIDIVLAKGRTNITNLNTDNFDKDLKAALEALDVDVDKILKIQRVETSSVDMSKAFSWQEDFMEKDSKTSGWTGSSSTGIGNITITNNGANVNMIGNDRLAGKNAIYTIPAKDSQQKFSYSYNLNFGDSFNSAGMLLRVTKGKNASNVDMLTGYMIAFNNTRGNIYSASQNKRGGIFKFEFTKGTNRTNFSTSTAGSKITLVQPLNINMSGTVNVTCDNKYITVSGGGMASEVTVAIDAGTGYGFGFFSDHYSHGCSSIGSFNLTGISLEETNVQHFTDVLKQPNWSQDSIRVIVNANDYVEEDFGSPDAVADILARCLNEHLNYVSWGPSTTKTSNETFIAQNSGNGFYQQVESQSSYATAIQKTAEYIKSLLPSRESQGNEYVIADKYIDMQIKPVKYKYNTATSDFPNGRWKLDHDPNVFDNPNGAYTETGLYRQNMDIETLSKVGKYDVYFQNDVIKTVYVHRMPVAAFSMIVSGTAVTLTNLSYDMDRQSITSSGIGRGGIQAEKWSYKEVTATSWTNGKLTTITPGKNYIVQLEVQDYQGQWSEPATKYIQGTSSTSTPVADFIFSKNQISKYNTDLTMTNMSYDPKGLAINAYRWNVVRNDTQKIVTNKETTTFAIPSVNFQTYGTGTYAYTLEVRNSQGTWSDSYTRYLSVIEDTDVPEITVTPNNGDWSSTKASHVITATMRDEDSKLKQYRYAITTTQTQPAQNASNWTGTAALNSAVSATKTVTVNSQGTYYVHIEAIDNAGNRAVVTRGPYKIDTVKPTVSFVKIENLPQQVPVSTYALRRTPVNHVTDKQVQITLTASDATSQINRVMYKLNTSNSYVQATRSGSTNNYVFRITTAYDGDISVLAYDNAGNVSDELILEDILLINSAPVITITNNTDWQTGNPVRFPVEIVTDSRLTISSATFATTESTPTTGNLTHLGGSNYAVDLLKEGVYFFNVTAVNNAGTSGYMTSEVVRIDRTAPVIRDYEIILTYVLPSTNPYSLRNNVMTNRALKIDFDITDNLSGFDHLEYMLPGDSVYRIVPAGQTYFTVEEAISGNIIVRAYDVAGNLSLTTTISDIVIDTVEPEIYVEETPDWTNQNVDLDITVTDDHLLEKIVWFTTESPDIATAQGMTYNPATSFPGTVTLSNEGIYTLLVSAYDKAGNIKKVESETIKIDKTKPEIIDLEFYMPQISYMLDRDEEVEEEGSSEIVNDSNNAENNQDDELENDDENNNENNNENIPNEPENTPNQKEDQNDTSNLQDPNINTNLPDTPEDSKEENPSTPEDLESEISYILTIKHVDVNDVNLIEPEVLILDEGSSYTTEKQEIENYEFKEMKEESDAITGTMDENKTVIYVYSEIEEEPVTPPEPPVQDEEPEGLEDVEGAEEENLLPDDQVPLARFNDNIFGTALVVQIFPRDILGNTQSGIDKVWYSLSSDDNQINVDWTLVEPDEDGFYFFTIEDDFTGTVYAKCSDIAGNISDVYSEHITLDKTNPSPTLAVNVDTPEWCLIEGHVYIQAMDINGLESVYVEVDVIEGPATADEFELISGTTPTSIDEEFVLYEDGVYEITVTARDIAGNEMTKTRQMKIDRTIPEIEDVVFSVVDDNNAVIEYDCNITNQKLLVEVDLSDNLSGFDYMEYQTMDNLAWQRVAQGVDEFYVATAYKGNIKVRIYDKAGNMSTVFVSEEITVETEAPTLIVSKDEAWTAVGVTLHVDANDPLSGVTEVVYSYTAADGIFVEGRCEMIGDKVNTDIFFDKHGSYDITFVAYDTAGNEVSVTRRVNIDRTTQFPAPNVNFGVYTPGTWSPSAVYVALSHDVDDIPLSGIKKYQYRDLISDQWVDGVPTMTGFMVSEYEFRAISNVGCISDVTRVYEVKIDQNKPVILENEVTDGTEFKEPIVITVEVEENESGLAFIEYRLDNEDWVMISGNVIDLGNQYMGDIEIRATDICGNVSDVYIIRDLTIDFDRPRLRLESQDEVRDIVEIKATERIRKGTSGYIRIYDANELSYMAPLAELHITNNRIKVEKDMIYLNVAGIFTGQKTYYIEVDEGFVTDLALNPCYPMDASAAFTDSQKQPALIGVEATSSLTEGVWPGVYDDIKNEYNVYLPTTLEGEVILTTNWDLEISEMTANSRDIILNSVVKNEIRFDVDNSFSYPIQITIEALASKTIVNVYKGDINVEINYDAGINARVSESDIIDSIDFKNLIEPNVSFDIVFEIRRGSGALYDAEQIIAMNKVNRVDNLKETISGYDIAITLYKVEDGVRDAGTAIHELQSPLRISLEIDEEYINRDMYSMIRVHNGQAAVLPVQMDGMIMTFESDKFSSYFPAVGEIVENKPPVVVTKDWSSETPLDYHCIVPALIENTNVFSRFSYVNEEGTLVFIKPVAGNYSLTERHVELNDIGIDDTWYFEAVHSLAARGIISGYEDGSFGGENTITRAEFIVIIARLENLPMDYTRSSFKDVSVNDWYFQYIEAAHQAGLINGIGNKMFSPRTSITREEMAQVLVNYLKYKGKEVNTHQIRDFYDMNQVSPWAVPAINAAANCGLIQGYANGNIAPKRNATRGETAAMVWRFIKYVVDNTIDTYVLTSYVELEED